MPPEKSNRRLGRGLDALFNPSTTAAASPTSAEPYAPDRSLREILISRIAPNPFQPRRNFDAAELRELQESLATSGLLQPITVRPVKQGKGFELIAGERRLRAATNLGWSEIPAVVRELGDREMLTLALVENLQRADLNPVEEAEGYERLIAEFGYTQQSVAEMVGKDRSTIANVLRILHLPDLVRQFLQEGKLTPGQARPLLSVGDQARVVALARRIVDEGWSARQVEQHVRETLSAPSPKGGRPRKEDSRPAEVKSLEQRLRKYLQTDVTIAVKRESRGSIIIDFYSPDDLERLVEMIGVGSTPH